MNFDFADESPKLVMLLYGLVAFVVVVGGLLLLLDAVPAWFARRREAQLVAAAASGAPLSRRRAKPREGVFALFFLLPAVLLLTIGLVVPAVRTTLLSFMDGGSENWVGLRNYGWLFAQDEILRVILNTMVWVLLVPLIATTIGLLYAVMVDKARLEAVAKSLIFMPMAISFVGASIIWKFVYAYRSEDQEQIGLLNQIVVSLGGEPKQWLLESPLNTLLLIVIMVWIQAGFAMVVLSAAIKAIPAEIVEAARLDGVNPWQMFWQVTLPSIRPALIVVVVTISIATLKVFDIVRTSTNGNYDTSVVANEMYNQAFRYGQNGQGAALAVFLFILVIPIVIYQIRNLRQQREG
ncbi:ABC transporter permease [Micromonospora echinospora]|uniref:Carbohydrate ABC transporter membrane protein 1, CUT1 family n=1 Tax=Micromonospora echinospora TaxID=1877 RepID=A0A1C4XS74_MICEC|nr:sugar ABC transporter permease [Micromonospora echinospora]OZV78538.1 ABC transporter permease [Micromonospora echinospora]SCF11318.1 carbohydrate ABC transporter membrane protein 1, CUT1 family [Micromonospora echinospora]